MAHITSHRELRVWQQAMDLAMELFQETKKFPAEERYSLTDQMRRSSRSTCSNIAETWRKRRYAAAFVSKLSDAETEATETQNWIEFAVRCKYMSALDATNFDRRYEAILGQLVTMMNQPEKWTINSPRPPVSPSPRRLNNGGRSK